jgi:hypothetical protein
VNRRTGGTEAVTLFCYQVKKWIGAFAAALGGLDTLVFAGGIGENAPTVRARICDGLGFLGIELDEKRNAANDGVISAPAPPRHSHGRRVHDSQVVCRGCLSRPPQRIFAMGARFAKWRAVIAVGESGPSRGCVEANAQALARYAALCQEAGLVPSSNLKCSWMASIPWSGPLR